MLSKADLPANQPVFFFRKGAKFVTWHTDFVWYADDHIAFQSSNLNRTGAPIAAAYEVIEIETDSQLFQELNEIAFFSTRFLTILDDPNHLLDQAQDNSDSNKITENDTKPKPSAILDDRLTGFGGDVAWIIRDSDSAEHEEGHLWLSHEVSRSYLCKHVPKRSVNDRLREVSHNLIASSNHSHLSNSAASSPSSNSYHDPQRPDRDIENTKMPSLPSISFTLPTSE